MTSSSFYPVEILYRPSAYLRMRPRTRGNYIQRHNHVYAEAHGVGLIMDVFVPTATPSPCCVVDVVSGGWQADRAMLNEHIGLGLIDALCAQGITVFAVSPGSLSLFTGQEMVFHVHAAVRHIKENAAAYGVLPECMGIMGVSAGGQLAALAALSPQKGRPAAHDPLRRWRTDVAAAAVFFPPTDLLDYGGLRFDRYRIEDIDTARLLFRGDIKARSEAEIAEALRALSPALSPINDPPPFMIVQGKADAIVPWTQAEKLANALRRAGGTACLVYKEGGGHVWPDIHIEVNQAASWMAAALSKKVVTP